LFSVCKQARLLKLIFKYGLVAYNRYVDIVMKLPENLIRPLLQDAKERDLVTARRSELLNLLWFERFLTRDQLIVRIEMKLGKKCFGAKAWKDNFYRDMRFVKNAFSHAGYELKYSRSKERAGYYLAGEGPLHPEVKKAIRGALDELDDRQIAIYRKLSPAQIFFKAVSTIEFSAKVSELNQQ
jgi:hypothetical protein